MFLDIFTPEGFFDFSASKFRIGNFYSRSLAQPPTHTVSPATALVNYDFSYLVAGDFNIHNLGSDPLRVISCMEERTSAPYFDQATDLGYTLLNTPGIFTHYLLSGEQRPSVIDLAFADPHMFLAFRGWDATSPPSTGSDHVPIVIMLAAPSQIPPTPHLKWDETDWLFLEAPLRSFIIPPPPANPSLLQLDHWVSFSLNILTALVRSATPISKPSLHSKPWWTPLLIALCKEYSKATRIAKKSRTASYRQVARHSRNGYFKAIKRAKATYWSSFLARTTAQNIWTVKKFVSPRKTPWFPSLPEADSPATINQALLDHFYPAPLSEAGLLPTLSHEPLTKEEIAQALSKSSPSSAPGPDEVPYLVWKKVNHYNPEILPSLLAPLVEEGYHPPCLKHANGVVLDKPGKPSYDSRSSFRIIDLLKPVSKILERVLTVRLMFLARNASLLHPNQCGSLPGLSATDAVTTVAHVIRTLQRPRWTVSTLVHDIKVGFCYGVTNSEG